jgi:excisionase family DNA binding protein
MLASTPQDVPVAVGKPGAHRKTRSAKGLETSRNRDARFEKDTPRFAELPDILTPRNLQEYLPLGRNAIYEMLQDQTIRNIRVGQKFLIPKTALGEFIDMGVELGPRWDPTSQETNRGVL